MSAPRNMLLEFTRESVRHLVMSAVNTLLLKHVRHVGHGAHVHREIHYKRERPSNMLAIDFAELVSHLLRSPRIRKCQNT